MKVEPAEIKNTTDNLLCPFCQVALDFKFNESFGEGVTFICNNCNKRITITNEK